MKIFVVQCFGKELSNKTKARLFGRKVIASTKKEAILKYRKLLKQASVNGYVEYGTSFEGIFTIGHMVFSKFKARAI